MDAAVALERFRARLSRDGRRTTGQRDAIATVFFEAGRHLSLLDILDLAKRISPGVGFATVYRTMRMLADWGLASEHRFDGGQTLYEPIDADAHHDHLICVRCGRVVEYEEPEVEALQERVAARYGMRVVSHKHEIYGECLAGCRPPVGAPGLGD